MIVLAFADIFGKPGRRAVAAALPDLIARYTPDIILGNHENLAGGRGMNRRCANEMWEMGFHGLTGGNHTWDNKEILPLMEQDIRIIRPANFPNHPSSPCPGRGYGVIKNGSHAVFVINVMGRLFMDQVDCPFQTVDRALKEAPSGMPIIVDMHADATSEKNAMGWFLDGKVAAVLGSHSHIQTADERILPNGTAFITDVGMSGSYDSVIGLSKDAIVKKFLTKRPHPYEPARENPGVSCVVINIGHDRKAKSIERLRYSVKLEGLNQERDME